MNRSSIQGALAVSCAIALAIALAAPVPAEAQEQAENVTVGGKNVLRQEGEAESLLRHGWRVRRSRSLPGG